MADHRHPVARELLGYPAGESGPVGDGTRESRDDTGRERGCTCGLTGPASAPRIVEIDSQCPLHGALVADGDAGTVAQ